MKLRILSPAQVEFTQAAEFYARESVAVVTLQAVVLDRQDEEKPAREE